jgi:dimethylargininase
LSRLVALTHVPSPHLQSCQCTYIPRSPIELVEAGRQHSAYCAALRECGCDVQTLDVNRELPDGAFIEDTAVVLDELAVLASMGTGSRRAEPAGIAPALGRWRELARIEYPATLEGGDVLRLDRMLLVGRSTRTNGAGLDAFSAIARRHGYGVVPVGVHGCLHLKTACTAMPDGRLLVNADWIDVSALDGFSLIPVPEPEPWGANTLAIGGTVLLAAAHRRTAELIDGLGFAVAPVELSEFAKAEAGASCLSLVIKGKNGQYGQHGQKPVL